MGKRYFISVDIDEEAAVEQLRSIQETVISYGNNSPTRPDQFHVTLNFIGEAADDDVNDIQQRLEKIDQQPFTLQLQGLGVFPSRDYISVVWAGTGSGSDALTALASRVRSRLEDQHHQEHDFHPHVTLMRLNTIDQTGKEALKEVLDAHRDTSFGNLAVDTFTLKESVLQENGAEHRTVREYDLG